MSIMVEGKEVNRDSIVIDFSMGIHESASFVDGTPLTEDQLCKLDEVRDAELMEAIQNFRRD